MARHADGRPLIRLHQELADRRVEPLAVRVVAGHALDESRAGLEVHGIVGRRVHDGGGRRVPGEGDRVVIREVGAQARRRRDEGAAGHRNRPVVDRRIHGDRAVVAAQTQLGRPGRLRRAGSRERVEGPGCRARQVRTAAVGRVGRRARRMVPELAGRVRVVRRVTEDARLRFGRGPTGRAAAHRQVVLRPEDIARLALSEGRRSGEDRRRDEKPVHMSVHRHVAPAPELRHFRPADVLEDLHAPVQRVGHEDPIRRVDVHGAR